MLTRNINFTNFQFKKKNNLVQYNLKKILNQKNEIIHSLGSNYINSYNSKITKIFKKKLDYRIIGMGGSTLGAQCIYDFLKKKIKKKFYFIDNLDSHYNKNTKAYNNLIISKSGNTIETIVNSNILIKKKRQKFIYYRKQTKLFEKISK